VREAPHDLRRHRPAEMGVELREAALEHSGPV
jgi:hypothetical protein